MVVARGGWGFSGLRNCNRGTHVLCWLSLTRVSLSRRCTLGIQAEGVDAASLAGYEVEVLVDRHQHCSYDQALAIADCLLSSRSQSQSRWVKSARALPSFTPAFWRALCCTKIASCHVSSTHH